MRLTPEDEKRLRRFVLGELDEEARLDLEKELVTDPEAFEALGVIEDELVEEYLDGIGTAAERQAFERHFLTSPERQRRVKIARALGNRASRLVVPRRPVAWRARAWVGLAAALGASLAGNVWLARQSRTPEPRLVAITLAAGVLRAEGSLPRLSLPVGTIVARLRLELPGQEYPLYRAVLLDGEGDEIWAVSKLRSEPGQAAVVLELPSGLLLRGDYQVKLSGINQAGKPEAAGTYAFRVNLP